MVLWFVYSFVWTSKQSVLGVWVAVLSDNTRVTLQFEGEAKGGTYKQMIKRDVSETREFGHWILKLTELRLIIMASDLKDHARFGVDSQYWVSFFGKSQITLNGPDRAKWVFRRASDIVKLDFDLPRSKTPDAPKI